jgi:hypothetical protein
MSANHSSVEESEDLLEWAKFELQRRLGLGERCRAEDFFTSLPELSADPAKAISLIIVEFQTRRSAGETMDVSEYVNRFPQWRSLLEQRLTARLSVCQEDTAAAHTPTQGDPPGPVAGGDFRPGQYEVYERLGHGGMGIVFRARDLALDRIVALKKIKSDVLSSDEVERFFREARAAARLHHPNIVPIYAIGHYDGQPCYTMLLAERGTLARHTERYRGDRRAAVILMEKVARALQAMHEAGVIHRDLKPGNILLDAADEPLVADFGLAKLADSNGDATRSGIRIGTPAYMSPEQVTGHGNRVTGAADIWALGVILYELLTGQRPFRGDSDLDQALRITQGDPVRPRTVRPDLPRDLEAIILNCLEVAPERRYRSAGALADDLRSWLDGRPVKARPPSWSRQVGRFVRRHALVLALVLAVGAAVAIAFWPPAPSNARDPAKEADERIQQQLEELSRGRAVTLIGNKGLPAKITWVTDPGAPLDSPQRDGAFTFQSMKLTLLQLLPEVPLKAYRFRAEVSHDACAKNGRVGIYLMRGPSEAPPGLEHLQFEYTFSDHADMSPRTVGLILRRYAQPTERGSANHVSPSQPVPIKTAGAEPGRRPPYRLLEVDVRVTGVVARLDGVTVQKWDAKTFAEYRRFLFDFRPLPHMLPKYPQGSLGLFVWGGTASFRNVEVEPLEDNE